MDSLSEIRTFTWVAIDESHSDFFVKPVFWPMFQGGKILKLNTQHDSKDIKNCVEKGGEKWEKPLAHL